MVRSCPGGYAAGLQNYRNFGQPVLNRTGAEFIVSLAGLTANIENVFALTLRVSFSVSVSIDCSCSDFAKSVLTLTQKRNNLISLISMTAPFVTL